MAVITARVAMRALAARSARHPAGLTTYAVKAGFERAAACLQGVPTNYHIDILMPILQAAAEVCPVWPGQPISTHWGFEDPAAVQGSDTEKRRAFDAAFRDIMNRVRLFVNLPLKMLDKTAIQREVDQIGQAKALA